MSIVKALEESGNFEVYPTKDDRTNESKWTTADIVLLEAAYHPGFTPGESLAKAAAHHEAMAQCKIILMCDETSAPDLAKEVVQFKREGLIDDFVYSSVSEAYLLAMLEAM
jgi:hypothetical protein